MYDNQIHSQYTAPTAPAQMSLGTTIAATKPKRSFGQKLAIGLGVGAAILIAGNLAGHAVGSSSTPGTGGSSSTGLTYKDPEYLAADLQAKVNENLAGKGVGSVTSMMCVKQSGTVFMCHADWAPGSALTSSTISVTVASDGNSYVSSPVG